MKRVLFAIAVSAALSGCTGAQTTPVQTPILLNTSGSTLLNTGTGAVTLTYTALGAGAAQTVTVNQSSANANTVYTATVPAACTGVVVVAGSTTATTSAGPTGSFTVTPAAIA